MLSKTVEGVGIGIQGTLPPGGGGKGTLQSLIRGGAVFYTFYRKKVPLHIPTCTIKSAFGTCGPLGRRLTSVTVA